MEPERGGGRLTEELFEEEGPLRFCQLTILSKDSGRINRVNLWLARTMDRESYSHYEDYTLGCHVYEFCLTDYERKQLEEFLLINRFSDFNFEVQLDGKTEMMTVIPGETDIQDAR